MIKAKHAGKPIPKLEETKPSNVINLMDALKRSVKAEKGGGKDARIRAAHRRGDRRALAKARGAPSDPAKRAS